jgi:hypothetical protein
MRPNPARMTWRAIREAFPDQYVVLDRVERALGCVRHGRVLAHSPIRREALVLSRPSRGRRWALEYTGEVRVPEGWNGFKVAGQ